MCEKCPFHEISKQLLCIITLLLPANAVNAAKPCRHALVLALDVSGSVNSEEYHLQIKGLSSALLSPKVQNIILEQPSKPISIAIFEWSSKDHQNMIHPWAEITSQADLYKLTAALHNHQKDHATLKTAIGSALRYGLNLLDQKKNCLRRTIDISSDGANNDGITPPETYTAYNFSGTTVNALVISLGDVADKQNMVLTRRKELRKYYENRIIRGPGAFTILALGYQDYERAMTLKLLKELGPIAISDRSISLKSRQRPL